VIDKAFYLQVTFLKIKMMDAKQLAALIGPTIIAVTISETINSNIWLANTAAGVYLNGALLFVAGLSIIRSHNYWVQRWPVIITLTGWFAMLLGLFRMFAPALQLQASKNTFMVFAVTTFVLAIGIFLTIKGYGRKV
jgi:hypothetical protein